MTDLPTRYATPEVHTIGGRTARPDTSAQEAWVPFKDSIELGLTVMATALIGAVTVAMGFPLWFVLTCAALTMGWGVAFHCALTRPRVRRVLFVATSGFCFLLAVFALLGAAVLFQSDKSEVAWGLVVFRVATAIGYIWWARVAFQARLEPGLRGKPAT